MERTATYLYNAISCRTLIGICFSINLLKKQYSFIIEVLKAQKSIKEKIKINHKFLSCLSHAATADGVYYMLIMLLMVSVKCSQINYLLNILMYLFSGICFMSAFTKLGLMPLCNSFKLIMRRSQ